MSELEDRTIEMIRSEQRGEKNEQGLRDLLNCNERPSIHVIEEVPERERREDRAER